MSEVIIPGSGSPEMPPLTTEPIGNPDVFSLGRQVFNNYLAAREESLLVTKPDGSRLQEIQASVRGWLDETGYVKSVPDYATYDREVVENKIGSLVSFLRDNHPDVPEVDLQATVLFMDAAFSMYGARPDEGSAPDADGSFAFVVPARMSRNNTEYGEEVEPAIPAFRYLPNELRAQLMVGLPPFIIDVYEADDNGKRGYLVFAPVFGDLMDDYKDNLRGALQIAQQNVNDAVDFAQQRLGVDVVGLGAILPAVTRYGRAIKNDQVITTTGHGGTVELIKQTVKRGLLENYTGQDPKVSKKDIAVLGLGSIGASIAHLMADEFQDSNTVIYDTNESKTNRLHEELAETYGERLRVGGDVAQVIRDCNVIVSAVTSKIDLQAEQISTMRHKLVVDDSQPGAFEPAQVEALGGRVAWVVGRSDGAIYRSDYDYATLHDSHLDVFGCEAEAASLAMYRQELLNRGLGESLARRIVSRVALNGPVTPSSAKYIGALFKKYHISAAPLQAFGNLITPPED